ncbi:hypothetical protein [Microbacterium lacticum]
MSGTAPEPPAAPDESEFAQAAAWLQRLSGDPLADAVPGRIRVDAVSDAAPRPRYQECRLEATVEAPGVPPAPVVLEVVIDNRFWPRVGQVLPARVPPADPAALEVEWEALRAR